MFVLSLCRQLCPDKLPVEPEIRLADGADGELLSIKNESNKVIKLCIFYEKFNIDLQSKYKDIQSVLDKIMLTNDDAYVKVYEHGYLGQYSRAMHASLNQEFIIYYYIMEKLEKLTDDEKKVFHSILSHEDRLIKKDFSFEKIKEMLEGMETALDFEKNKVMLFCENIKKSSLIHLDLHPRNIMKTKDGDYKLVDLDRININGDENG